MAANETGRSPRVLVSYAHERGGDGILGHRERALQLTQSFRLRGVEAVIDQFVEHDPPFWPRWMIDEVKAADYVLCLASPQYRDRFENRGDGAIGRGARWEGIFVTEELYSNFTANRRKFIAVVISPCEAVHIPDILRPVGESYYDWPEQDEELYRRLTGQPRVLPAPLGAIVRLNDSQEASTKIEL